MRMTQALAGMAMLVLAAIPPPAQAPQPKIDVVLQLANSLSEDQPYVLYAQALAISPNGRYALSGDTNASSAANTAHLASIAATTAR